jgi:hypothetical protein
MIGTYVRTRWLSTWLVSDRYGRGAMSEIQMSGGRVTAGVVRIGDTVRRPLKPNSTFVRALLERLRAQGFGAAPLYLGADERGREIFSFQPGAVPTELDATISDETLAEAARLIRRYHDATARTGLAWPEDVVCHNDLSPCNFVFRDGRPVGIIDFDSAAPGPRLRDLGYAIFLWLNLGTDGPAPREQARRIEVFCDEYGIEAGDQVSDAIIEAVSANIERLGTAGRSADVGWWQAQLDWIRRHLSVPAAN